jgi:hypothetical protein
MPPYLTADAIRKLQFQSTKNAYFRENAYARKYVERFMPHITPEEAVSDHEAKRLNGLRSFVHFARYALALGMEPYEGDSCPGFKAAVAQAVREDDPSLLEGQTFPYRFWERGLVSTHFDVMDPLSKGIGEKMFVSLPDLSVFPDDVREKIREDQHIYANSFSGAALALLAKLEKDGRLPEEEAHRLMEDYETEFSVRKVPVRKSTYDAVCAARMANLPEGKTPGDCTPETLAIGLVFSGVRNHCTVVLEGEHILRTPEELASVGVPKGNPPIQFSDGLVQTSSGGVKQQGELTLDARNPVAEEILSSSASADDKRARLEAIGVIERREFRHEYVEYAVRAVMARAAVERNGRLREEILPVWERGGVYYSALEEDRDIEGFLAGKYGENGFISYVRAVRVVEILRNKHGIPARTPGFRRDNAGNIFLGTTAGAA